MLLPESTSPLSIASTPSRNRAVAKSGSRATRPCTNSLKLPVRAIVLLQLSNRALCVLVVPPVGSGGFDIPLLAFLRAANEQDHKLVAVAAEINSVARTEI